MDISSLDEMNSTMNGVDAVINCIVERRDRQRTFDVNTLDVLSHLANLYAYSKGIGQEICGVFAEQSDIHLLMLLFLHLPKPCR
jgi:hypothetical protein